MDERKRIKDENLESSVDEAYKEFQRAGRIYSRGLLTDDEFWRNMYNSYHEHFYGFLKNNGLRTCFTTKSWLRFQEDHSLWCSKSVPNSSVGEPWLLDDNLDDHFEDKGWLGIIRSARGYGMASSAFAIEDEASVHDKSQFFRLMEAFHITADYFEPLPEGIIAPDKHWTHTYSGGCTYVIGYNCVDDGGLLSEAEPIGKTYTLKNDLGLKAVVTITEDRRKQDRGSMDYDDYCPLGEYLSDGYIEGYTALER